MTEQKFDEIVKLCFFKSEPQKGYFDPKRPVYLTQKAFEEIMNVSLEGLVNSNLASEVAERRGSIRMFSVASSSRLCFLYVRYHLGGVSRSLDDTLKCCERLLPFSTDLRSTSAHLDAACCSTYYECKCHEILKTYKTLEFSDAYKDVLQQFLLDAKAGDVKNNKIRFCINDFVRFENDIDSYRFDFAQFIRHLLGIAGKDGKRPCTLQYIFFRPSAPELKTVYDELETEVRAVFQLNKITNFCGPKGISLAAKYIMLPNFDEDPNPKYEKQDHNFAVYDPKP